MCSFILFLATENLLGQRQRGTGFYEKLILSEESQLIHKELQLVDC